MYVSIDFRTLQSQYFYVADEAGNLVEEPAVVLNEDLSFVEDPRGVLSSVQAQQSLMGYVGKLMQDVVAAFNAVVVQRGEQLGIDKQEM